MRTEPLTTADEELVDAAADLLEARFEAGRHRCAAAIRTDSGTIYTGINMLPDLGIAGVHAEPVALGQAVAAGDSDVRTSVAVVYEDDDPDGDVRIVPACGCCRELLSSIAPTVSIVVSHDGDYVKVPVEDLLPPST